MDFTSAAESIQGRGYLEYVNGKLEAPDNVIMTVQAARTYYNNFRQSHIERIKLMARIEGLIAGNPPYPPGKLAAAGLAHIANVNTLDAKSMYNRVALTFWNLVNQTENYVVFSIRPFTTEQDQDFSSWAEVLSRNWTKVIKEMWEDFIPEMNTLTGQLVKFGASPLVWPDEQDFRWTTVDLSRLYCADQTHVTTSKWDCICVETLFTVQNLYATYLETKDKKDSPWNAEALESFLVRKANQSNKGTGHTFVNMLDLQRSIQDKNTNFANVFSDSVRLVSLLYREFSGKISHYIFDPIGEAGEEFLFMLSEQYDSFQEAVIVFTYSPGEFFIHGNRGVGHMIFPVCQAMMQLDCNMMDMAKMSATPILKTNSTAGRNLDPIRFISGVATDIGQAEFQPNTLGANINQLVTVAQYMEAKVNRNAIIGGDDPGMPDQDRGSKSAPEVQMQSIKEFGVGKQNVAHFYKTLDIVFRQMTIKMLNCKDGHPGYDIVREWKDLCIEEGVPEEVFQYKDKDEKNKMPRHLSVRAARVAGDGSNLGLIMGLNGVAGIAGGFGQKGQYNYRKDVITSRLGMDYVDRYLSDSADPDESGSGASLAQLENLVMKAGENPQATKDNNHKTHIGSHMALIQQIMEQVQAQKMDPIGADKVLSVVLPHTGEHIEFLRTDELNEGYVDKLTGPWRQITKFAQLNRVKAQKMMQAEVRRRGEEEQQLSVDMMEQQRKDQVAEREQSRKEKESELKQERAKEQSDTKAEIMRRGVEAKAENERLAIELRAHNEKMNIVRKPQEILKDKTTEELQNTLETQVGTTPNPADFE